ncbi:MAG: DNA-directed RNA polymerase I subunit RPA34 [Victivallaceae bacterium]|nr:DNA-directed RNA polymerase I subunit RPA34 [Victivallaceae bacterium]
MKKQMKRMALWLVLLAVAAGAALFIHMKIARSGENTVMAAGELFKRELGLNLPIAEGVVSCVVARLDGRISAVGTGHAKLGSENGAFIIPATPKWKYISAERYGKNASIEIEQCLYDDLEFKDLRLERNLDEPEWHFTAIATVPLDSVAGTKLPADTKITGAEVEGNWTGYGINFSAADGSFSYSNTVELKPVQQEDPDEKGGAVRPVKIVKLELLSQNSR